MSKKREELLEQIWAAQDTAYDLMSEYDSLPHSYGGKCVVPGGGASHRPDRPPPRRHRHRPCKYGAQNAQRLLPARAQAAGQGLGGAGAQRRQQPPGNAPPHPAGEHVYRDHAAFDKQCQALTFRRLEGFTEAELATYLSIQRRINEAYADDVRRSREYFT